MLRSATLRRTGTIAITSLLLAAACAPGGAEDGPPLTRGLKLETVVAGLRRPVQVAAPADDPRLFIVEQGGVIRVLDSGRLRDRPFIDLSDRISSGGERGLLSVAFHPRYASNGLFFVDYTDRNGDTRIERFRVSGHSDVADPSTGKLILAIPQPFANHNGGLACFGPDGMLYVGMGDGGSAGDPYGNGQDPASLLGKLLRIDVDHGDPYAIPRDNPFVARRGARPEIWAIGLRNPWRFAFDPVEGTLYIADVGQNRWEEIDVRPASRAGLNYGWNWMEGNHCFRDPACNRSGLTLPALEYPHSQGCSVTGGLVYRGKRVPRLVGHYLYADYCEGWIRSFRWAAGRITEAHQWDVGQRIPVSSFGEDADGEAYVVSHEGSIYRLAAGD